MKFKLSFIRNIVIALTILVITFGAGYRYGQNAQPRIVNSSDISGKSAPNTEVDFSLFWNVWDRLNKYYIDRKMLDPQKMVYGAISGMVASLGDPYTVFLPPQQNTEAKNDLNGKFEGIGVQLGIKDKKIVVVAPLKGLPGDKAGLKSGDYIIKVDGNSTDGWTLPEAVSKIRGEKGTSVTLTVMKKDATSSVDIKVVRDTINVASVEWEEKNIKYQKSPPETDQPGVEKIKNNNYEIISGDCNDCEKIIYLKLSRFGDQTTDEWNKAVTEITGKMKSTKGIIFDLRNNPGGYLSGSVFIASEFLKGGTVVTQDSIKGGKQAYEVDRQGKLLDVPMVVLINKGTASASEIVAGALSERGRAKTVGETTFGKGSVQEAQDLPGGAGIHITMAKWLLPSGKWINGTGITPDIKVVNDDTKPDEDLQLQKAIEVLVNKN